MPQFGGSSEKCSVCSKTVYLTEKIVVEDKDEKKTFHKQCLKCSHCQKVLSLGNYASMNGVMYCKPHFKQLFATRGNYDEGFGKEKHTTKWAAAPVPTRTGSFVPVENTTPERASPQVEKPAEKPVERPAEKPTTVRPAQVEKVVHEKEPTHADKPSDSPSAKSEVPQNVSASAGRAFFEKAAAAERSPAEKTHVEKAAPAHIDKVASERAFFEKAAAAERSPAEKAHVEKGPPPANIDKVASERAFFEKVAANERAPERKDSPSSAPSIASRFTQEKCSNCNKTVYATEKIVIEDKDVKKIFHKQCLKCSHCQKVLSLGNYASMQGVMYCKPHFKQLFATKGNYDEGFGKEKHAKNWSPIVATPQGSFVPVTSTSDDVAHAKTSSPSGAPKAVSVSVGGEKCVSCNKTVYATEKTVVEDKEGKKTYHKACLKCAHCSQQLTLGNYAGLNGVLYCKPHFKQLFATKGNYDEGFSKAAASEAEDDASTESLRPDPVHKEEPAHEEPDNEPHHPQDNNRDEAPAETTVESDAYPTKTVHEEPLVHEESPVNDTHEHKDLVDTKVEDEHNEHTLERVEEEEAHSAPAEESREEEQDHSQDAAADEGDEHHRHYEAEDE